MDYTTEHKAATAATRAANERVAAYVASNVKPDMELATRGRLAEGPRAIKGPWGNDVWSLDAYDFMNDDTAPDTVNPSLWRQGRLNNVAGLFEVVDGIYQVRGHDISNVTFIRGARGWVVIDPLTTTQTAAAAKALIDEHFGARDVTAVIYTHSHTDHFGGCHGLVSPEQIAAGVPVIAPTGFMEEVTSENVMAGTAMLRRGMYMFGALLEKGPRGQVDTGLGKGLPAGGSLSYSPPTVEIGHTGATMSIDGVDIEFQFTPETEAPAEMALYFPQFRAFCAAENCTATQHNILTLRGAKVRDALGWSKYIDEAMQRYGTKSDVVFASHHWPRWGTDDVVRYLASQRDAYRYVHDQTLRLANHGYTPLEIAEELRLPDALHDEYFNHGYYGTVSHNSRAVYQRYLGYFDGVPAHLNPHPPVAAGQRYVAALGGAERVLELGTAAFADGDFRWTAELVNHLVFSDPANESARLLLADAYEQLAYQAESGVWRNIYLTGAKELRDNGNPFRGVNFSATGGGQVHNLTMDLVIDVMGIRLNGPAAAATQFVCDVTVSSRDNEAWHFAIEHGVIHGGPGHVGASTRLRGPGPELARIFCASAPLAEMEHVVVEGDTAALTNYLSLLDDFSFGFDIALP